MRKILEKFPSDFKRDDSQEEPQDNGDTSGGEDRPEKKPKPKPPGRGGGDDAPLTIRDLKKLIALKSVGDEPDDEEEEDVPGSEKSVTDTGKEPNVVKKEPVVQ
jgi:hypothetical protein